MGNTVKKVTCRWLANDLYIDIVGYYTRPATWTCIRYQSVEILLS